MFFFSIPAFGLLLDKRLFTPAASHPVPSPIKLYINKDTGLSSGIEPSLTASGYEQATPHYADYILDMRSLLDDVVSLHATDSDYSPDEFLRSHFVRNRDVYDLDNSSASGVGELDFVHPEPNAIVPVAPSSTITVSQSGQTIELGALQFQDIDMDEIMWQPFTRPKKFSTGLDGLPIEPIFPMALPAGGLPTLTALDEQKLNELGLNAPSSGGVLVTGDALVPGTSIKLLTGSGQTGATEGNHREIVPWAKYPSDGELCRYYETQNSGLITASGRQAIYDIPAGLSSDKVYLLDASNQDSSGLVVQTFPGNFHATSGIDANGKAHNGPQTVDRLMYNIEQVGAGRPLVGRSLINGKRVFGHFAGEEAGSNGQSFGGAFLYATSNSINMYGGVVDPVTGGGISSRVEWGITNNRFSPVSWSTFLTTSLGPAPGVFGAPDTTTYNVRDQVDLGPNGAPWIKLYNRWGTVDYVVTPGGQQGGGGERVTATINYTTRVFREGTDSAGNFQWVELDPPDSPLTRTEQIVYYNSTFFANNIFSFFFFIKPNNGLVNVGNKAYIQWSDIISGSPAKPQLGRFAPLGGTTSELRPSTSRRVRRVSIGFFPSWKLRLYVTTNNQVSVPDRISVSPAATINISFDPSLSLGFTDVEIFGPPAYDSATDTNYIYFQTLDSLGGKVYFAKMTNDFVITEFNEVDDDDAILSGRAAIFDI